MPRGVGVDFLKVRWLCAAAKEKQQRRNGKKYGGSGVQGVFSCE